MKDACYKKVKSSYDVFPSARASQAIAKCRKSSGNVIKSEKGSSLKRWARRIGKISRAVKLAVLAVRTNTADQLHECLLRHQRPRVRLAHQN